MTLGLGLVVTLATLALPDALKSANPYLQPAWEQLSALNEEQALLTLADAKRWPKNTARDLARVQLLLGLAHGGLAHETEAVASFRLAHLFEPSLELPAGVPQRIREWWARAVGRVEDVAPTRPAAPAAAPPPALIELRPRPEVLETPLLPIAPVAVTRPLAPRVVALGCAVVAVGAVAVGVAMGAQVKPLADQANAATGVAETLQLQLAAQRQATAANVWFTAAGGLGVCSGVGVWFGFLAP